MIFCSVCAEGYHAYCIFPLKDWDPSESIRRGWRCAYCTACELCRKSEPEESLLLCDRCERGYHIECLKPVSPCFLYFLFFSPLGDSWCPLPLTAPQNCSFGNLALRTVLSVSQLQIKNPRPEPQFRVEV